MSDRLTIVGPEPDDDVIAKKLDKVNIELPCSWQCRLSKRL
jgi:hypothetical protein